LVGVGEVARQIAQAGSGGTSAVVTRTRGFHALFYPSNGQGVVFEALAEG
jgi:hypothetical protein